MSKSESIAYGILLELSNKGGIVQIEKTAHCYEVTVWPNRHNTLNHTHFQGDTLLEAIMKIK
jgi:hypothetical protein